jgi:hypothetical protein
MVKKKIIYYLYYFFVGLLNDIFGVKKDIRGIAKKKYVVTFE